MDRRKEGLIPLIERRAGVQFERIGAPQPADMARLAGERAAAALAGVDGGVVPWFAAAADTLLASGAFASAGEALARALAIVAGCGKMTARSLLTAHEGYVTLALVSPTAEVQRPGFVFSSLRRWLPDATVEEVKRLTLTADGKGAVFDVPTHLVEEFLAKGGADAVGGEGVTHVSRPTELPELKKRDGDGAGGGYGGVGGYGGGGYGGGGGG